MSLWPLGLSAAAGALTTFSPCVLPVLPLVVGASTQEHRHGPLAMAAGMIVSFTALTLALASAGGLLGLGPGAVRAVAAGALMFFGMILLSSTLSGRLAAVSSPLAAAADGLRRRVEISGLKGQLLAGALLGAVWSPCAGPTLGAALALAAESGSAAQAAAMMVAFGLGASAPLLAIGYGAREILLRRRETLANGAQKAKIIFGAVMLASGALILTGLDKTVDARLVALMPSWLVDLTTRF